MESVKSWLDHSEVRLVRKFKVSNAEATPTLDEERVPNKDELRAILGGATAQPEEWNSTIAEGDHV